MAACQTRFGLRVLLLGSPPPLILIKNPVTSNPESGTISLNLCMLKTKHGFRKPVFVCVFCYKIETLES